MISSENSHAKLRLLWNSQLNFVMSDKGETQTRERSEGHLFASKLYLSQGRGLCDRGKLALQFRAVKKESRERRSIRKTQDPERNFTEIGKTRTLPVGVGESKDIFDPFPWLLSPLKLFLRAVMVRCWRLKRIEMESTGGHMAAGGFLLDKGNGHFSFLLSPFSTFPKL